MPSSEELAVATIHRLAADGYTSSVMKLSRPVLNELGRRLVEPGAKRSDILAWLRDGKGVSNDDLPERNIDRFAQRFRELYKTVWGEAADKLLIAELQADPDFDTEQLQVLIKNRVTTIVAQEVMTSDPAELKTDRLNAALSMIIAADKGKLDRDKLALATRQAEDRARKLEADLELIKQRLEQAQRRFDAELKQLTTRAKGGKVEITDQDIADARRLVFGS